VASELRLIYDPRLCINRIVWHCKKLFLYSPPVAGKLPTDVRVYTSKARSVGEARYRFDSLQLAAMLSAMELHV